MSLFVDPFKKNCELCQDYLVKIWLRLFSIEELISCLEYPWKAKTGILIFQIYNVSMLWERFLFCYEFKQIFHKDYNNFIYWIRNFKKIAAKQVKCLELFLYCMEQNRELIDLIHQYISDLRDYIDHHEFPFDSVCNDLLDNWYEDLSHLFYLHYVQYKRLAGLFPRRDQSNPFQERRHPQ